MAVLGAGPSMGPKLSAEYTAIGGGESAGGGGGELPCTRTSASSGSVHRRMQPDSSLRASAMLACMLTLQVAAEILPWVVVVVVGLRVAVESCHEHKCQYSSIRRQACNERAA